MFLSTLLGTAIGLTFMIVMVALTTMVIQEFVASVLRLRARTLQTGLKTMLTDAALGTTLYTRVLAHPAVTYGSKTPSYIPANSFSAALIDILGGSGTLPRALKSLQIAVQNLPAGSVRTALQTLFQEGETDPTKFEARLRQWFDTGMDRLSGTYKRRSQVLSFVIAGVIAVVFGLDAFKAAELLWMDPTLRETVQKAAGEIIPVGTPMSTELTTLVKQTAKGTSAVANFVFPIWEACTRPECPKRDLMHVIGCGLTAAAASFAGPFLFELLQKFVNIRGTGPVPPRSEGSSTIPESILQILRTTSTGVTTPLIATIAAGGVLGVSGTLALAPGGLVQLAPGATVRLEPDGRVSGTVTLEKPLPELTINKADLDRMHDAIPVDWKPVPTVPVDWKSIPTVDGKVVVEVDTRNAKPLPVENPRIQGTLQLPTTPVTIRIDGVSMTDIKGLLETIRDGISDINPRRVGRGGVEGASR
jgi:hypothetical protein